MAHVVYCALCSEALVFAASALLSVGSPLAVMTVVASVLSAQHTSTEFVEHPRLSTPSELIGPLAHAYLTVNTATIAYGILHLAAQLS